MFLGESREWKLRARYCEIWC